MEPIEIAQGIHWVGAADPHLRVFDIVMHTAWGTTYNAYLIRGQKTALVETVKERFFPELLEKLKKIIDPAEIDYIIVNHTEPDHSGAVGLLLEQAPKAEVLGTRAALKFLEGILNRPVPGRVVADGEELDLGGKTLQFIYAPFLHWPDSMFTYLKEQQTLFTCDVFGAHYFEEAMVDHKAGDYMPALKYYFDVIFGPFRDKVRDALGKIEGLDIKTVAPGHGPVLVSEPCKVINFYREWSKEQEKQGRPKAIVGYVSAYGYTGAMAEGIGKALEEKGIDTDVVDISQGELPVLVEAFDSADAILIGSPTINRDTVKPVWDVLASLSAITNKNKPAAVFGSYGWSGEAVGIIEGRLKGLGLKVFEPGLKVNFRPSAESLVQCAKFAGGFAEFAF